MEPYDWLVILACVGILAIFILGILCVCPQVDDKMTSVSPGGDWVAAGGIAIVLKGDPMSNQEYLKRLTDGNLVARLKRMADDYLGPCGASASAYDINQAKRKNLLEAIRVIELFDKTLNDKDNK